MNKILKHGAEATAVVGVVAYGVYEYYPVVQLGVVLAATGLTVVMAVTRVSTGTWNHRQLTVSVTTILIVVFILATSRTNFGAIGAALLVLAFLFIVFQQTLKPHQK